MAIGDRPARAALPDQVGEHGLGWALLSAARDLRAVADRQLESVGLTMQQAEVLVGVSRQDEVKPRQLTALLLTDEAGVSRLVDRLMAKRLLLRRRSAEDRRSVTLELTPAGRDVVTRLLRHRARVKAHLFAGISEADAARLRTLLRRIAENARGMPRLIK